MKTSGDGEARPWPSVTGRSFIGTSAARADARSLRNTGRSFTPILVVAAVAAVGTKMKITITMRTKTGKADPGEVPKVDTGVRRKRKTTPDIGGIVVRRNFIIY
jgi:hypothetical protein